VLKELRGAVQVDEVARAPEEKEVEELGKEKIHRALRDTENESQVDKVEASRPDLDDEKRERFKQVLDKLVGTRALHLLDEELEALEKIPLDSVDEDEVKSCHAAIFDGEIDRRMVGIFEGKADFLIGMRKTGYTASGSLELFERNEL